MPTMVALPQSWHHQAAVSRLVVRAGFVLVAGVPRCALMPSPQTLVGCLSPVPLPAASRPPAATPQERVDMDLALDVDMDLGDVDVFE